MTFAGEGRMQEDPIEEWSPRTQRLLQFLEFAFLAVAYAGAAHFAIWAAADRYVVATIAIIVALLAGNFRDALRDVRLDNCGISIQLRRKSFVDGFTAGKRDRARPAE